MADRCIDVFVGGDGSFGYEEYPRDIEDGAVGSLSINALGRFLIRMHKRLHKPNFLMNG